jgi:hypothetical protein
MRLETRNANALAITEEHMDFRESTESELTPIALPMQHNMERHSPGTQTRFTEKQQRT